MSKKLVIRGGQKILGTLSSGIGDPILTKDPTTSELGTIGPIDPSAYLTTSLPSAQIFLGNSLGIAAAVSLTGAISITNTGVTSINPDVITNANINSGAGIIYSKLNLTGSIVNADIAANANIVRTKLAPGAANRVVVTNSSGVMVDANAITPSRVLVSDINGIPVDSTLTTTVLGYVDPTSSIQTQLDNRLSFGSGISPIEGDLVVFQSGIWNRFPRGTSGQYLSSTVGGLAWVTTPNGLPVGGLGSQVLRKIDSTDYNTEWHTVVAADLTDVTATASQINVLATGFYDATSSIQTQLSFKLSNSLANNAMFVGNTANQAAQLPPGSNGQVLSIVAGVPQWQTISGTGTVTSVALSGGSTGLTVTGSPITTTGTITLAGTLGTANGGTNLTSYTTGDIIYASAANVLSKLGIGTAGQVLTVSGGGIVQWSTNAPSSPLTTKGDIYIYSTTNDRLPVGADGYHLTADSTDPTGLKWVAPVFNPFSDLNPLLMDNIDNTKLAKFEASGITTATTRTYTLPDFNGTIALLGATNGAALSKVDDTNVTLSLSAGSSNALLNATLITIGWTGTLAYARFVNGGGLSVVGRSASSSGVQADITGTADQVLRVNGAGTILGFGSIDLSKSATVGSSLLSSLNGGTGLDSSAWSQGDIPYISATGVWNHLAKNTSSTRYLSNTGTSNNPAWAQIDLTNGVTGVLPVANGGTNIASYTVGDLIYASGSTTLSKLADVAVGSYLRSGGVTTAPIWSTVTLPNSATTGDLLYASSSNTYSNLAVGSATTVLHGGTTPSYSAVVLTTDVSGILPIANGGTGSSSQNWWGLSGTSTLTGVATITSNVAVQHIFNGTWTATANNQNHIEWAGTITSRNTASDTLNYFVIDPTLTRNGGNPATQTVNALLLNPTFTNSFTNQYIAQLQNAGSARLTLGFDGATTITAGNSSTNTTLKVIGIGTTTNKTFQLLQSDGTTNIANYLDNGQFTHNATLGTVTANNTYGWTSTVTATSRATASDLLGGFDFNATVTANSTSIDLIGTTIDSSLKTSSGISTTQAGTLANGLNYVTKTTAGMTANTYTSVAPASTSGSGTGALFTVVVANSSSFTSFTVTTAGSNYNVGDTVTFNGTQFGSGSGSIVLTILTTSNSLGANATALRIINRIGDNNQITKRWIDCVKSDGTTSVFSVNNTYTTSNTTNIKFNDPTGTFMTVVDNSTVTINRDLATGAGNNLTIGGGGTFTTGTGAVTINGALTSTRPFSITAAALGNAGISAVASLTTLGNLTSSGIVQGHFKTAASSVVVGVINTFSFSGTGTNGTYSAISATGGTGTGAIFNITVSGGSVTAVTFNVATSHGINYTNGDVLTCTITGGTATITVTAIDFVGNVIAGYADVNSLTDAKSGNYYHSFYSAPTYNITSTQVGTISALYFNPTLTATGSFNKYGVIIAPTGFSNGFGTTAPTATVHIVGSGSIPNFKTVGVGTSTNKSFDCYQSDGTTNILFLKDNGDFQVGLSGSKLGFFGTTAISKITTGVAGATFTANSGTGVNDASTFGGYTIKQIVQALQNYGLLT